MTLSELSRRSGRVGLLWEVASLAPRGQGLRERALPFLEDLSQITRENVQLAVREVWRSSSWNASRGLARYPC